MLFICYYFKSIKNQHRRRGKKKNTE